MANTQANKKLFVCTTPQPNPPTLQQFELLEWIQVGSVGRIGETGTTTNILTYNLLDTDVSDKAKGVSNAGDPEVECARVHDDPGQVALREMALTNFKYAFKIEYDDAPTENHTSTVKYNWGLVAGPRSPNGQREDFELEIFTLAFAKQREIVVNPELVGS